MPPAPLDPPMYRTADWVEKASSTAKQIFSDGKAAEAVAEIAKNLEGGDAVTRQWALDLIKEIAELMDVDFLSQGRSKTLSGSSVQLAAPRMNENLMTRSRS